MWQIILFKELTVMWSHFPCDLSSLFSLLFRIKQPTQRIINGFPDTYCPFSLKWQLLHKYFNFISSCLFRNICWMSTIPKVVGKGEKAEWLFNMPRLVCCMCNTWEQLWAFTCSWFSRDVFSIHLFRMYLTIHPTEIVCHSIWMTFICPKPQLLTAFSLPMPSDRGTKPPRDVFPPMSPPFFPRTAVLPAGPSLATHTFKSSSF